jgi:hypothetical protein
LRGYTVGFKRELNVDMAGSRAQPREEISC